MGDTGNEPVSGVVESIDGDLARVLVGPADDEWFFPVSTLPAGTVEGNSIAVRDDDGRLVADGFVGSRQTENSIEERLSRGISRRRTVEMDRSDLRAAIDKVDGAG